MAGVVNVRAALETALNAMSPALSTAWQNVSFTPVAGTAYQRCFLLPANPVNAEMGRRHDEVGIFQIDLMYPLQGGSSAAETRAELIRTTFYRSATFVSGGVAVVVQTTPHIEQGLPDGDRWKVTVKMQFKAQIQ